MERNCVAKIDVVHCVVGETPKRVTVDDNLPSLQALVGGYIEMVRMRHGLVAVCNEEGILMELPMGFAIMSTAGLQPIRGNLFVCRINGSKFSSISDGDIITINGDVFPKVDRE